MSPHLTPSEVSCSACHIWIESFDELGKLIVLWQCQDGTCSSFILHVLYRTGLVLPSRRRNDGGRLSATCTRGFGSVG